MDDDLTVTWLHLGELYSSPRRYLANIFVRIKITVLKKMGGAVQMVNKFTNV